MALGSQVHNKELHNFQFSSDISNLLKEKIKVDEPRGTCNKHWYDKQ
jgi:hypothetical protein